METDFRNTADHSGVPAHDPIPRIYMNPQEIDVVRLLVQGCSNAEIAARLGVPLQTVKSLLSALYEKLKVSTRLQLVLLAIETGFDRS